MVTGSYGLAVVQHNGSKLFPTCRRNPHTTDDDMLQSLLKDVVTFLQIALNIVGGYSFRHRSHLSSCRMR